MARVPISVTDEIFGSEADFRIVSDGMLDLDSGDVSIGGSWAVSEDGDRRKFDADRHGFPASLEGYEFSSGMMKIGDGELEFAVSANPNGRKYEVSLDELEEIKKKALALASSFGKKESVKAGRR